MEVSHANIINQINKGKIDLEIEVGKFKKANPQNVKINELINKLIESDKDLTDIFIELIKTFQDAELSESFLNLNNVLLNLQKKIVMENCDKLLKQINDQHKEKMKELINKLKKKMETMDEIYEKRIREVQSELEKKLAEGEEFEKLLKKIPQTKEKEILQKKTEEELEFEMEELPEQINKVKTTPLKSADISDPAIGKKKFVNSMKDKFSKNILFKNNFENLQQGGAKGDEAHQIIIFFYELYSIFNSDLFLKILTLMGDKKKFTNTISAMENIKIDISEIIRNFFMILEELQRIFLGIDKNLLKIDDAIYRKYFKKKKNENTYPIFIYKLIKFIYLRANNLLDTLFNSDSKTEFMIELFNRLGMILIFMQEEYKKYKSQEVTIDEHYNNFINETKKIFTYVKIRQDTTNSNPRFNVKPRGNKLFIRYYNTDEKINIKEDYLKINEKKKNTEYYYLGPFDNIYNKDMDTEKIIKHGHMIINKLTNSQNVCVIGYGQSGSGKTSSLIYLDAGENSKDGVLIGICNHATILNNFKSLEITMINIFVRYNMKLFTYENIIDDNYLETDLIRDSVFVNEANKKWVYSKNGQKNEAIKLGKFINDNLKKRQERPTPNNPNSSRSHVLIIIKFKKLDQQDVEMVICDLAGVENKFKCNDMNEILNFADKYTQSSKYKMNPEASKAKIKLDKYLCKQKEENKLINEMTIDNKSKIEEYNDILNDIKIYNDIYNMNNKKKKKEKMEKLLKLDKIKDDTYIENFFDIKPIKTITQDEQADNIQKEIIQYKNKKLDITKKSNDEIEKYNTLIQSKKVDRQSIIELFKIKDIKGISKEFLIDKKKTEIEAYIDMIMYMIKNNNITELNNDIYNTPESEIKFIRNQFDLKDTDENIIKKIIEIKKYINLLNLKCYNDPDYLYKLCVFDKTINYFDKNLTIEEINNLINENKKIYYILNQIEFLSKNNSFRIGTVTIPNVNKLIELLNLNKINYNIDDSISKKDYEDFKNIIDKESSILKEKPSLTNFINNQPSEDDEMYKIIDTIKKKIFNEFCYLINIKKIRHNCDLRVNEGYLINKSLKDLREDIKNLIINSIKINFNPLVYISPGMPYCFNSFLDIDKYEPFNETKQKDMTGEIMYILGNRTDFTFFIFTVINLNSNANNPPSIPYININEAKFYYNIYEENGILNDTEMLKYKKAIQDLILKLNNFNFYIENYKNSEKNIIKTFMELQDVTNEIPLKEILETIYNINASTLIGSLESTEIIKNLYNDKFICSKNKIFDDVVARFEDKFVLTQFSQGTLIANEYSKTKDVDKIFDENEEKIFK